VAAEANSSVGALAKLATQVASGSVQGRRWTLWARRGEGGAGALEDGGVVIDGRAYGLCPGYPNPAELEMVDTVPRGTVYGVVDYPGRSIVKLSNGRVGTFASGAALPSPTVRVVNGVSFFIGLLPRSACMYHALELNVTSHDTSNTTSNTTSNAISGATSNGASRTASAQHNLGFGTCVANQLVPITASMGEWDYPTDEAPIAGASPSSGAPVGDHAPLPQGVVADGSPGCSTDEASQPRLAGVQTALVRVEGAPFDVATAGSLSFVSLGNSLGVFSDKSFAPTLVRTVSLPQSVAGETITPDGRYLLAATDSGFLVVSLQALDLDSSDPVIGSVSAPSGGGGIEVVVSPDGRFAFVSLEGSGDIAVFDLHAALADHLASSHFVGTIPLGDAPVGMAVSPDGKYLYATSEAAGPGVSQGTLTVVSLSRAESDPGASVRSTVTAGCGAVRVVTSNGGSVVWVTARESDQLLGFSAGRLVSDPTHALLSHVEVGEAPVGEAVVDDGKFIVVANSNRFSMTGAKASLSVVETASALAGKPSLIGEIPAGQFPRQFAVEPNGETLLVTNFRSSQLEAVNITAIPR